MRLKELRKSRSLYQKDIAAHLGIDRTTYVKYENGSSEPPLDALISLCQYYSVSLDYLVGLSNSTDNEQRKESGIDNLIALSSHEHALIRAYRSVSLDTQKAVCNVLGIESENLAKAN